MRLSAELPRVVKPHKSTTRQTREILPGRTRPLSVAFTERTGALDVLFIIVPAVNVRTACARIQPEKLLW